MLAFLQTPAALTKISSPPGPFIALLTTDSQPLKVLMSPAVAIKRSFLPRSLIVFFTESKVLPLTATLAPLNKKVSGGMS